MSASRDPGILAWTSSALSAGRSCVRYGFRRALQGRGPQFPSVSVEMKADQAIVALPSLTHWLGEKGPTSTTPHRRFLSWSR